MSPTQAEAPHSPSLSRRILVRTLVLLAVASCVGLMLHYVGERLQRRRETAGFKMGMLHGALMPLALPNLLVGHDVAIYAVDNTGRTYKLGYTVGVNACGAIFFGFFFWRFNRWRRQDNRPGETNAAEREI